MRDCDRTEPVSRAVSFPVVAGSPYEIRVRLERDTADPSGPARSELSLSTLRVQFFDRADEQVDARVATEEYLVPHLDPLPVEVLSPFADPGARRNPRHAEKLTRAGTARRFFVAPPDAVRVEFAPEAGDVTIADLQVAPACLHWPSAGEAFAKTVAEDAEQRCRLIDELTSGVLQLDAPVAKAVREIPAAQIAAVRSQFAPGGDWAKVLESIGAEAEAQDFDARVERLASDRTGKLSVGFVGTVRSYHRLRCLCDIFWLREGEFEQQLSALQADLVLVETAPESGPGDWDHAFSSLDGGLPASGRALFEAARSRGVRVHFHVTVVPTALPAWRAALALADRVIVEAHRDWTDAAPSSLPHQAAFIRRATEPAAAPAALLRDREPDLMLVPVGSDIFHFQDFAEFLRGGSLYETLIADFHYGFEPKALAPRLSPQDVKLAPDLSERQRKYLLQNATILLLNGISLRTEAELLDLALDGISAGAIPVIIGPTALSGLVVEAIDRIETPTDLMELQRLFRIPWVKERRWRALYLMAMRNHLWRSNERTKLLGRDPFPEESDCPKITVVLISKRPHLLERCLNVFRGQSWPNKELVLVLNSDAAPEGLPFLSDNERVHVLPEHFNIGRCLNMAIDAATGRYWVKMDDDDYYSSTFLEEYVWHYHATQADMLGRQAPYFYFERGNCSRARISLASRCMRALAPRHHVSGATLSGRTQAVLPRFSNRKRNSVDSAWVEDIKSKEVRAFVYDSTSIVVHRAEDESNHTWMLSGVHSMNKNLKFVCAGNVAERLFCAH